MKNENLIKIIVETLKENEASLINKNNYIKAVKSEYYLQVAESVVEKFNYIPCFSKSLNADELITSLGTPDFDNEYILKPDKNRIWWVEHKHVGSGEPLKQWLTGKP